MTIESPCTKVCVLDAARGICIGCGRTRSEIAGWLGFSRERRREIMAALPLRLADVAASGG